MNIGRLFVTMWEGPKAVKSIGRPQYEADRFCTNKQPLKIMLAGFPPNCRVGCKSREHASISPGCTIRLHPPMHLVNVFIYDSERQHCLFGFDDQFLENRHILE